MVAVGIWLGDELDSSRWQARWLVEHARTLRFDLQPGADAAMRVPASGPFDERLGYTHSRARGALVARGYDVTAQARQSPALEAHVDRGLFAPFREKTQAGLSMLDCRARPLYEGRYPHQGWAQFDDVPPLLPTALSFIEDRGLLAEGAATRNPVVDPPRLARAAFDQLVKRIDAEHSAGGGSTLATQIEKYRHSPDGRTAGARDKLRQIASASLRVYADGEDTRAARRRILLDYVNTVPLGPARLGRGARPARRAARLVRRRRRAGLERAAPARADG